MRDRLKITDWAPLVVSVAALSVAILAEVRGERRFDQQLKQAEQVARAQVRPLVGIYELVYAEKKGVVLFNRGAGAAVITKAAFVRKDQAEDSLVDHFDLGPGAFWTDFVRFGSNYVVKAGAEINLVLLSKKTLEADGLTPAQSSRVLAEFKKQKEGIAIRIEYEDVLGNSQPPYEIEL